MESSQQLPVRQSSLSFLRTTESSHAAQQVHGTCHLSQSLRTPPGIADWWPLVKPPPLRFKYCNGAKGDWGKKCPKVQEIARESAIPRYDSEQAWRQQTNDCSYLVPDRHFYFPFPHPPKLNAQGEFKTCSPNCDQISVAAPDETDLIWMVTFIHFGEQNSWQ